MRTIRLFSLALLAIVLVAGGCARHESGPASYGAHFPSVAADFARVVASPVDLRMFLQRFPKGGDLHNHLSGTIYAEDYLDWAIADGRCVEVASLAVSLPPCDATAGRPELANALANGSVTRQALVDAWSMRYVSSGSPAAFRHDHFFRTFALFSEAQSGRDGDMLAEAMSQAAGQHIGYLELMLSLQRGAAVKLGRRVVAPGDWGELADALLAAGIADLIPRASQQLDEMERTARQRLGCSGPHRPDCAVEVRYLAQVVRNLPPEQVFAQSMLAFLLVRADSRVVGLNIVAAEDDPIALSDYQVHMQQLKFLAERLGSVPIALHAGELALGGVPLRHLRNHIRQAVEIAGAARIGHGVSIAFEDDAEALLREMARKQVAVEINLTSNDQILGITGENHPFMTYRNYRVPLTLSTDDQGVSRGDLTNEYQRAVQTYRLGFDDIVELSRNGLNYAFVAGESLWADVRKGLPVAPCATLVPGLQAPDDTCAAFLGGSPKARLQWQLEEELAAFAAQRAELGRERER